MSTCSRRDLGRALAATLHVTFLQLPLVVAADLAGNRAAGHSCIQQGALLPGGGIPVRLLESDFKHGRFFKFFFKERLYLSKEGRERGKDISGQILVQIIIKKLFKKEGKETHLCFACHSEQSTFLRGIDLDLGCIGHSCVQRR